MFKGERINLLRPQGQPFTLAFVITPIGNYVISGGWSEVRRHVRKYHRQAIIHYSTWQKNMWPNEAGDGMEEISCHRGSWDSIGNVRVYHQWPEEIFDFAPKNKRFAVQTPHAIYFYRRMPKKWLSEWS